MKRYLRCVDRFLMLLMICVHVTSGQPGRGSEITTMRHRNGLLQDRNLFIMDGQVMTVVRYHKSQSQYASHSSQSQFAVASHRSQVMQVDAVAS